MPHRLLIVEDDPHFVRLYRRLLADSPDFNFTLAFTLAEARRSLAAALPDAMLLDWMLPDGDGLALIREIRSCATRRDLLIFMVTARTAPEDCVMALTAGADDFVEKPPRVEVLLARLQSLARRKGRPFEAPGPRSYDGLSYDCAAAHVEVDGRRVHLHPKEIRVLETLLVQPNVLQARAHLWEQVWGRPSAHWDHILVTTISSLRHSLGKWSERIECRKGMGYILNLTKDERR